MITAARPARLIKMFGGATAMTGKIEEAKRKTECGD
jgi:hypothetical protein